MDALLNFGNIRQAFRTLRSARDKYELTARLKSPFNHKAMMLRGSGLPLEPIARDDRYLIAEVACKTYDPADDSLPVLSDFMMARFQGTIDIRKEGDYCEGADLCCSRAGIIYF
jgi:hypothetical protein